jgi:hypothetical protein
MDKTEALIYSESGATCPRGIVLTGLRLGLTRALRHRKRAGSPACIYCIVMVRGILHLGVSFRFSILYIFVLKIVRVALYGGPADFAGRLHDAAVRIEASGDLEFLNSWCVGLLLFSIMSCLTCYDRTYKLGEEGTHLHSPYRIHLV